MPRTLHSQRPDSIMGLILGFIGRNPDCTVRDISDRLGFDTASVKKAVHRLRDQGKVARVKLEDVAFVRYRVGSEGDMEAELTAHGMPHQRRVSDWKPCMVRDPLIDLFFGRNV